MFTTDEIIEEYHERRSLLSDTDSLKIGFLVAEIERLRKGLDAVEALVNESAGVYGLHLNGDPAPWESLRTGGYFEAWLKDFDVARTQEEADGN